VNKLKVLGVAILLGLGLNKLMATDSVPSNYLPDTTKHASLSDKIDNLAYTLPVKSVTRVEKSVKHWGVHFEHDDLRGTDIKYSSNASLNKKVFNFPYNKGAYLSINYRSYAVHGENGKKNAKTKDVYLYTTDGQFDCGYDGCYASVRFDDGKVQRFALSRSTGGRNDVLFVNDAQRFVKAVSQHKNAIIEVPFWQYGPQQFSFILHDENNVIYSS